MRKRYPTPLKLRWSVSSLSHQLSADKAHFYFLQLLAALGHRFSAKEEAALERRTILIQGQIQQERKRLDLKGTKQVHGPNTIRAD